MACVRAKFQCCAITHISYNTGTTIYKFSAMYDPNLPEDQRYAKYTPAGSVEITVDNPGVAFDLGKSYYLDFTPADETTDQTAGE